MKHITFLMAMALFASAGITQCGKDIHGNDRTPSQQDKHDRDIQSASNRGERIAQDHYETHHDMAATPK